MGVNKVTPIENFPTPTYNNNMLDPNACELQEISSNGSFNYLQSSIGKLSARSFDVRAVTKTSFSNTIHVSSKRMGRPETPPPNNLNSIFPWFRYNCLTLANLVIIFVLVFILLFCVAFALTIVLFTGHVSSELSSVTIGVIKSKVDLFMKERLGIAETTAIMAQQDIRQFISQTSLTSSPSSAEMLSSNIKQYLSTRVLYYNMTSIGVYFENSLGTANTSSMYKCQLVGSTDFVNSYIWSNQTFNSVLNTYQTIEHKNTSSFDPSLSLHTIVSSHNTIPSTTEETTLLSSDFNYRTFSSSNYLLTKDKFMNLPYNQAIKGEWLMRLRADNFYLTYTVPIVESFQFSGVSQVEFSILGLVDLMKGLTCSTKGYVILSDVETEKVIFSSLPELYTLRPLYDITELNIGKLFKYLKENSLLDFNSEISVNGIEFQGLVYNMLNSKFSYNSINLGMTIVVVDDTVQEFHDDTLYLAICISVGYIVIGLVMAIILGFFISRPLKALSVEFGHIKHMDLEKVKQHFSLFGEFQVLFQKLDEMVVWLNDVRSFIPNSILMEIRGDSTGDNDQDYTETELVNVQKDRLADTAALDRRKSGDVYPESSLANIAKGFKTYQEYSVLYMRLMGLESLTVTERAFYFEKVLEISSKIAKKNNGDIQLLDISRIRIYYCDPNNENASRKVISMALKIMNMVADFSASMEQQGKPTCELIISVSTQKALVGNIGTKEHRIHTIVSRSISLCEQMMLIAKSLNISLIVDSNSCADNLDMYVYRPVDRITVDDDVMVIYEILRENQVNDQEWMYELEQKQKNNSYNEYLDAFQVLLKGGTKLEDYREAITKVRRFKGLNGVDKDLAADHLIFMLERVSESCERGISEKLSPQFTSSYQYCSRIYTEWENKFGMDVLRIRPVEIVNNK